MTLADQDRIAALESQVARLTGLVDHLYVSLGVHAPGTAGPGGPLADPRVLAAVGEGNLISAIKIYREITGCGLAEASEAVRSLAPTR
jgi:ribosomal protein L7/L12